MIKNFEQFINESRYKHLSKSEFDLLKDIMTQICGLKSEINIVCESMSVYLTFQESIDILHRLCSIKHTNNGSVVILCLKYLCNDGISIEEKKRELDRISQKFNDGKRIPIDIDKSGKPITSDDIDMQCGWEDDGSFERLMRKLDKPIKEHKNFSYDQYDYTHKIMDLISDCVRDTIELIEYKGNGRVELKDWRDKFYFYKEAHGLHGNRDMESGKYKELVAIEIDDDIDYAEEYTGEDFMYDHNGDFLVAVTDDGERIPVDFFTCPTDTLIGINMAVIENIDW